MGPRRSALSGTGDSNIHFANPCAEIDVLAYGTGVAKSASGSISQGIKIRSCGLSQSVR
jgi:hypothetical protein